MWLTQIQFLAPHGPQVPLGTPENRATRPQVIFEYHCGWPHSKEKKGREEERRTEEEVGERREGERKRKRKGGKMKIKGNKRNLSKT